MVKFHMVHMVIREIQYLYFVTNCTDTVRLVRLSSVIKLTEKFQFDYVWLLNQSQINGTDWFFVWFCSIDYAGSTCLAASVSPVTCICTIPLPNYWLAGCTLFLINSLLCLLFCSTRDSFNTWHQEHPTSVLVTFLTKVVYRVCVCHQFPSHIYSVSGCSIFICCSAMYKKRVVHFLWHRVSNQNF